MLGKPPSTPTTKLQIIVVIHLCLKPLHVCEIVNWNSRDLTQSFSFQTNLLGGVLSSVQLKISFNFLVNKIFRRMFILGNKHFLNMLFFLIYHFLGYIFFPFSCYIASSRSVIYWDHTEFKRCFLFGLVSVYGIL